MSRLSLTVLYEVGHDWRPHSSPYVRFLRPLSHPSVQDHVTATFARDYQGEAVDAVILDRLWGPWLTRRGAEDLLGRLRRAGVPLLYHLDDNLLDLAAERGDWPTPDQVALMERLLAEADGVLVSTAPLRDRVLAYNPKVAVVPNALDERLVLADAAERQPGPFEPEPPLVIGLMGTLTHDQDVAMVLPALAEISRRHGRALRMECIGAVDDIRAVEGLDALPIRYLMPAPGEAEYPLFMLWFTSTVRWDIALAPLLDSPFNRCKSDLKYLDYAAIGAAGVFSRVAPYCAGVRHLETGWLAENRVDAWIEAIDTLITDNHLRRRMANAARAELMARRSLAHRAMDLVRGIHGLLGNEDPSSSLASTALPPTHPHDQPTAEAAR